MSSTQIGSSMKEPESPSKNPLVYLSLGSNISPRKKHIFESLGLLKSRFARKFRMSGLYRTLPYQGLQHPFFYNCCAGFKTRSSAVEVLETIGDIEKQIGRIRSTVKWEPRRIDLDILLFEDMTINLPDLTVPHYDVSNRDFFLIPLLELDADLINPRTNKSLQEELTRIPERLRTDPVRLQSIEL
ncbi:MAG: 2-amino-4-hydroxy-6-hydroxymethyldihydropteridine diphosphokinase [Proteobacteria bacterium]|nr:2-amino-4-hydroxy-6-hydroxymethyldihydropteridine diphosphokinase [Pseudomonadota bacterium]